MDACRLALMWVRQSSWWDWADGMPTWPALGGCVLWVQLCMDIMLLCEITNHNSGNFCCWNSRSRLKNETHEFFRTRMMRKFLKLQYCTVLTCTEALCVCDVVSSSRAFVLSAILLYIQPVFWWYRNPANFWVTYFRLFNFRFDLLFAISKMPVRPNKLNTRFLVPARTPSELAACLVCVGKLNYVAVAF